MNTRSLGRRKGTKTVPTSFDPGGPGLAVTSVATPFEHEGTNFPTSFDPGGANVTAPFESERVTSQIGSTVYLPINQDGDEKHRIKIAKGIADHEGNLSNDFEQTQFFCSISNK